ncbi:hypothetical protein [Sphingomonas sp. CFBP 8760]|uniref:hypothetical protein n=1 Tax=Sphingomonas sp. CFBP 8760 TaxID=2775282 RepID=UPI001780A494|nr:hypothetical protein [Sphingomonas sp. CFBP 8760]MBD8548279.1 hypothetical protein [Sphingomonas sp. CFBP 8760]
MADGHMRSVGPGTESGPVDPGTGSGPVDQHADHEIPASIVPASRFMLVALPSVAGTIAVDHAMTTYDKAWAIFGEAFPCFTSRIDGSSPLRAGR